MLPRMCLVAFLAERQKGGQHVVSLEYIKFLFMISQLLEDILRRLSGFELVQITPTDIHGL